LGVAFIELIRQISPNARIIYNASDDLAVLGCAPFLLSELEPRRRMLGLGPRPISGACQGFYTRTSSLFYSAWDRFPSLGSRRHIPIWKRHSRCVGGINAF
jgi:hypothetical protein